MKVYGSPNHCFIIDKILFQISPDSSTGEGMRGKLGAAKFILFRIFSVFSRSMAG